MLIRIFFFTFYVALMLSPVLLLGPFALDMVQQYTDLYTNAAL